MINSFYFNANFTDKIYKIAYANILRLLKRHIIKTCIFLITFIMADNTYIIGLEIKIVTVHN